MKKIIFIIVLLLTITSINHSQWYQQNSGTTDNFHCVQFANEEVGWATTNYTSSGQSIYRTTDGGENWLFQYAQNPLNPIFQISFSSENIGWISTWLSYGPGLLKTSDGGSNWFQVYFYPHAYEYINDFEFINPDTGWFVGEETIIYDKEYAYVNREFPVLFKETTDGGITWTDKNFPPNHPGGLNEIEAIGYRNLIVIGYDTLFRTADGGNNWQKFPIFLSGSYELQFFNLDLGWANMNGILVHTTDGGNSWIQQFQPCNSYHFVTSSIGWCTSGNEIYVSTDGGYSWTLQNSNTNNSLADIFFIDSNNGWAVGANGIIVHTINGGIPVELVNFISEAIDNKVILNWSTATETNNQGFEILRRVYPERNRRTQNDNDWVKIGFINGHGTTTEPKYYSYVDESLRPGQYQYKLKQIDFDGSFEYSKIVEITVNAPKEFSLSQNYPNPFNPTTKINWQLPVGSWQTLKIFDMLGNEITTLVNEYRPAGEYEVEFSAIDGGSNLPSGIYFYQLKAGTYFQTKKMVLIK